MNRKNESKIGKGTLHNPAAHMTSKSTVTESHHILQVTVRREKRERRKKRKRFLQRLAIQSLTAAKFGF